MDDNFYGNYMGWMGFCFDDFVISYKLLYFFWVKSIEKLLNELFGIKFLFVWNVKILHLCKQIAKREKCPFIKFPLFSILAMILNAFLNFMVFIWI